MNTLLRVRAVAAKELWALVKQPQLLLLLLAGPVGIMVVFALSFNVSGLLPRAVVVVEEGSEGEEIFFEYENRFTGRTEFLGVLRSVEEADAMLRNDQTDAVIIIPSSPSEAVSEGRQATLEVHYDNINPIFGTAVPNRANGLVLDLNRDIVREGVIQELQAIRPAQERIAELNSRIDQVNAAAENLTDDEALQTTEDLDEALGNLESALEVIQVVESDNERLEESLEETRRARELLGEVRDTQEQGSEALQERVGTADLQESLASISAEAAAFPDDIPAQVLVSPLRLDVQNLAPFEPDAAGFYAPSVLGLLVQHIALSLASLAIVRERLSGAYEFFEVSPLGAGELLAGKFITYLGMVVAVNLAVAGVLSSALDVPLRGGVPMLAAVMALLSASAIALGFALSAVTKSTLQAIQVSMLAFIAGGFFSGFLFPLDELGQPASALSYLLPATYGIRAFQDVMIRGLWPNTGDLIGLVVILVLSLGAARFMMGRGKGNG
ncbi:ABC transporter permease [Rubrobacter indicoceani]|uniref:ABC transporter permease n=1 Tax=Rubrobacter indicoceani TaxID=2051957 RepID=UPI000E5C1241|nr:ABC transporter permease [Rubrobacter indicoceani]